MLLAKGRARGWPAVARMVSKAFKLGG